MPCFPIWVLVAANLYFGMHTELSVGMAQEAAAVLLEEVDLG